MRSFPFSPDAATGLPALITITRGTQTIRFTTYHEAITIGGNTWQPGPGATITGITYPSDGSPSTADIQIFTGTIIPPGDGARGIYDGWPIKIEIFDPDNIGLGTFDLMPNSTIYNIAEDVRGIMVISVNGALAFTRRATTEHYSMTCRATLGDARCKVDLSTFTSSVTGQATGAFAITLDSMPDSRASDPTFFVLGTVLIKSGALNGFPAIPIRAWDPATKIITTFLAVSLTDIPAGTSMDVAAGCDFTRETCFSKFNNIINGRFETFVPPSDPRLL